MKKIQKLSIINFIIFLVIMFFITNYSFAASASTPKKLGLYIRTGDDQSRNGRPTGYYTTGTTTSEKQNIPVIKIVEYNDSGTAMDQNKLKQVIYCLKDGVGFATDETSTSNAVNYTEYENMRTSTGGNLSTYINSTLPGNTATYNKLMWLLDNICMTEDTTSILNLLKKAGDYEIADFENMSNDQIKDVIEVIQQCAIWYLTNVGDKYQPTLGNTLAVANSNGGSGTNLEDKFELDAGDNVIMGLYDYLIEESASQSSYDYKANTENIITFDSSRANIVNSGNNVRIGPYRITTKNDNYTNFRVTITSNSIPIEPTIIKNNSSVSGNDTTDKIKQTLNNDFYIELPYNTTAQINIDISANIKTRNLTFWSTSASSYTSNQPVVIIEEAITPFTASDTKNVQEPKTQIDVTKTWVDAQDQDGIRPQQITVNLLKNGTAFGKSVVLNEGNSWHGTFTDLSIKENGSDITYTVQEQGLPAGYTANTTGNASSGFTITNTHIPGVTSISVNKVWSDSENQDGLRTSQVVVKLMKNGVEQGQTKTLSASNGWHETFTGLPTHENGAEITYTVEEVDVPSGYIQEVTGSVSQGFTITNKHTPDVKNISVQKAWSDPSGQETSRPTEIEVELLKNGQPTGTKKKLNAGNQWKETFSNLPVKDGGNPITYSVRENNTTSGYTVTITGSEDDGFTITNTFIPKEIDIPVTKVWNDSANQDGLRTDEIVVELLCNQETTGQELTLNAQNSWNGKFTGLKTYEDGITKTYTVREKNVPEGYTQVTSGDMTEGYKITNTHNPTQIQVSVNKVWVDNNNEERPTEITVELLKNGNPTGKEQTLSEANGWTYTFTELPQKENGQIINYSVREKNVPEGYTASVSGDMNSGFTITNTYKIFDLALRKYITKINGKTLEELRIDSRKPNIVEDSLQTGTTATYEHKKDPILVKTGDVVTYSISIYNEGEKTGYAKQITDQLPTGLVCTQSGTVVSKGKDGNNKNTYKISYDEAKNIIVFDIVNTAQNPAKDLKPYQQNELDYETIEIECRVDYKAIYGQKNILTNTAWISEDFDTEDNVPGKDIDSQPSNHPDVDKDDMQDYKGKDSNPDDLTDKNHYYEGEQDDDDFEKLRVTMFDLALRKFITAVNGEELMTDGVYDRAPTVDVSPLLNGEDTAKYNHTKEPLRLHFEDIITYTLRIYNEGEVDGYAQEITEHLPPELEFLPDDEINKKYLWVVDSSDNTGRTIKTNYLSKEVDETGNLIKGFNSEGTLDYRDLQIRCRIRPNAPTSKNLTNIAEITDSDNEYDLPDRDNKEEVKKPEDDKLPDYKGKDTNKDDLTDDDYHYEGQEDDDDFEKVFVQIFDLALRKWVSQVILIEDGVQKEMDTGHYAEQEPEPVVKVELNKERIENTVVKFRYQIRITNEGEIEGYATEISDYIPQGLVFKQADNPKWKEVDGKIVTDQLKDTLLKPGEYAIVEVVLTWVNSEENLDLKINTAEISKDENELGEPDIDSTPDNQKQGEDDIDDAPVILTTVTGSNIIIITSTILGTILIIGIGAIIIKKFVV